MNFDKLVASLVRVNREGYLDNKQTTVGSLLKKLRKLKNITQSEMCDKVCSVSYTSKLEMNKIKPAPDILHTLMERVGLPEETTIVLKNQDEFIKRTLEAFYLSNGNDLKIIYDELSVTEHLQVSQICMMAYYIFIGDFDSALKIMKQNVELVSSMSKSLVNLFALFSSIVLFEIGDIRNALDIAIGLPILRESSRYVILAKELIFKLFVILSRGLDAMELYDDLIQFLSREGNSKRIKSINEYYLKLLFDKEEYRKIITLNEKSGMFDFFKKDGTYNLIIGTSYFECKEHINAKYYLDQVKVGSSEFDLCVKYKYHYSIDKEDFIRMIEELNALEENFYLTYFLNEIKGDDLLKAFQTESYRKLLRTSSYDTKQKLKRLKASTYMELKKYKEACMLLTQIEKEEVQMDELLLKRR